MKKIFLVSLMIVAFVCLFAISAFADDIVTAKTESEEYGTVIQLSSDPGLDNAKQYVSTLNKINDTGTDKDALCILTDGTYYYVFPSSYIVWEIKGGKFEIYAGTETNLGLAQAMAEFNTAMGTSYYADYSIVGNWGDRRLNELVRFEFTTDVTWVDRDHCLLRYCSNLVEVRINHVINFGRARTMFRDCKKLTTVVGLEKVTNIESDSSQFMGCSALESVKLPTDIVRIPGGMFWGCGKVTIENLSELTQLTTIGDNAFRDSGNLVFTLPDTVTTLEAGAFQSAFKSGGSFTINKTSQLTTIGVDAFRDCRTLKSIYIPSSVTNIGSSAFRQTYSLTVLENFENCQITELAADVFYEASALKSIKLPKTLTTINGAFYKNQNLALVYLPDSITLIADTFTDTQPTNAVYVYTGKDVSVLSTCARLANATIINASDYAETNTYEGVNLVVGYSNCIVYNNGAHGAISSKDIVTSYLEAIKIADQCTTCGMALSTVEISALFTCVGYSVTEYGVGGITIGYTINNKAIEEYTAKTGKALKFGTFAVLKDTLGQNDIFANDGTKANGVISNDITERKFDLFDFRIGGFTQEYSDIKLAIGAYVAVTDGESTEYSYLQADKPDENEKYAFVSYNDLITA